MVAGGEQSGYGILEAREQLWMFSQFYGLGAREGWRRVDELIEAVGLGEQRNQRVSTLSTGQRQKMNFARGLLNDPWVFFLDEPTLGLDVSAARSVRELWSAGGPRSPGRTVLLTTHYMAEADELCERIAIVDRGRILAIGSPAELKRRVQRESIFRLELDRLDAAVRAAWPGCPASSPRRAAADARTTARCRPADRRDQPRPRRGRRRWRGVVAALDGLGAHIVALRKSEPSLEDVFVELVGRGLRDDEEAVRRGREPADRATTGRPSLPPMPSADEAEEADRVGGHAGERGTPAPCASSSAGRRRSPQDGAALDPPPGLGTTSARWSAGRIPGSGA